MHSALAKLDLETDTGLHNTSPYLTFIAALITVVVDNCFCMASALLVEKPEIWS